MELFVKSDFQNFCAMKAKVYDDFATEIAAQIILHVRFTQTTRVCGLKARGQTCDSHFRLPWEYKNPAGKEDSP